MTAYYFAGRYSRNAELRTYRDELQAKVPGARVTSRWVDQHGGEVEASYTPETLAADPEGCWKYGQADLEDLANAEAIISFTGDGGGGKGGRHVEHGVAIAYVDNGPWLATGDFRLVVVGPREHIFHCHPATEVYPTWREFLDAEVAQEAQVTTVDTRTWCDVMEMDRAGCAHCRPADERRRLAELEDSIRGHAASPRSREVVPEGGFELGPVFSARYDGECRGSCGEAIFVGDRIRVSRVGWVHEGCEP